MPYKTNISENKSLHKMNKKGLIKIRSPGSIGGNGNINGFSNFCSFCEFHKIVGETSNLLV